MDPRTRQFDRHCPLETVDLVQSIELIFGIILVVMMLFRRQGLIPERAAVRRTDACQQTARPRAAVLKRGLVPLHGKTIDPNNPLLEIRGLANPSAESKRVRDFDLDVMPRSIVGIIGPNGSGKTTFFNLITGLAEPDGGSVLLTGEDVTGLLPHAIVERGIARTFQNLRLFANMTVMENVLVGTHTRTRRGAIGAVLRTPWVRREEAAARERVIETLRIFGNRLMPRVQPPCTHAFLREPAPARDRARACLRALASPSRRADGRDEPDRDARTYGSDSQPS